MPELGDTVTLYFPNAREAEGVIINSIRRQTQGGDKLDDPRVKYFRTKFGKELLFGEGELLITGKDGVILIRLEEEKGIEIYSDQDVKIISKNDLKIDAGKKLIMTAGEEIEIQCKDSNLIMNENTYIKSNEVKVN